MIYALVHPETLEVRYIGKAKDAQRRFREHVKDARQTAKGSRGDLPVYRWWRSLGSTPSMVQLGIGDSIEEKQWIAQLRAGGARLLNLTDGGDGGATSCGLKRSPETRRRMSLAQKGRSISEAHRSALSIAHTGKTPSAAQRLKVSETLKARRLAGLSVGRYKGESNAAC